MGLEPPHLPRALTPKERLRLQAEEEEKRQREEEAQAAKKEAEEARKAAEARAGDGLRGKRFMKIKNDLSALIIIFLFFWAK